MTKRATIVNKVENIFDDLDDLPSTRATTKAMLTCNKLIDDIHDIQFDTESWLVEDVQRSKENECEFLKGREGK